MASTIKVVFKWNRNLDLVYAAKIQPNKTCLNSSQRRLYRLFLNLTNSVSVSVIDL